MAIFLVCVVLALVAIVGVAAFMDRQGKRNGHSMRDANELTHDVRESQRDGKAINTLMGATQNNVKWTSDHRRGRR